MAWPRRRSSSIVLAPKRASIRTCFGAWSCGAKKPGKWSEDSFGASIASWIVMPNASRYRMNCSDHCSCWSPPIVPKVIHGLPRRNASEGVSVVRGRLPGATTLG